MIKTSVLFLVLSLCTLGCSEKEIPPPPANPEVRVGVDPNYPPFEFYDENGLLVGFDIDLISEICRLNGWQLEIAEASFDKLIPGLTTGEFDLVISAISITPQREVAAAFSIPYCQSGQIIAVRSDDSAITNLDDLVGKRVGVLSESTAEQLAKKTDGLLVYSYRDVAEAFAALAEGELEAVLNDSQATETYITEHGNIKSVGGTLNAERYCIAAARQDTLRIKAINSALEELIIKGTLDSLHRKWLGYPVAAPETTE